MRKILFSIAVMFFGVCCTGCIASKAAKGAEGFAGEVSIWDLAGCYRNLGEGPDGSTPHYLSKAVWPDENLSHALIDAVRVVVESDTAIRMRGLDQGRIIHESVFAAGKDFELAGGKTTVHSGTEVTSSPYFIGLIHGNNLLGLDKSGNAKLQERVTLLGISVMTIPTAAQVRESYRFLRDPAICADR